MDIDSLTDKLTEAVFEKLAQDIANGGIVKSNIRETILATLLVEEKEAKPPQIATDEMLQHLRELMPTGPRPHPQPVPLPTWIPTYVSDRTVTPEPLRDAPASTGKLWAVAPSTICWAPGDVTIWNG